MKTIIAGSRLITDYEIVVKAVQAANFTISEVVSGCARGVDKLGERYATEHNIPIHHMPAQWGKLGKKAGVIRNQEMAQYAEQLIAVWDGQSKGTANMIDEAKSRHLKVFVYRVPPNEL